MELQKFEPFWKYDDIKITSSLNIILLAHVQRPRGHVNYAQLQCSETEHFSIEEFNEIYQGIVNAGYYIQAVYYNELDFLSDYIEHSERFENCLIYSLVRNGLGDNKKTVIPAFCELIGLKYTTSASLSCALCRNKYYFSTLFHAHGVPTPKSWLLTETGKWINGKPPTGAKVICKPCSESASQGVNEAGIVLATSELNKRFLGTSYIVQEYIDGPECEVPIFKTGNSVHVLPPVGINLHGKKILDEQTSAENHYDFYQLSDICSPRLIKTIQLNAEKAFRLLQMEVYGRIDFRIGTDGIPYIFDVSTTPYTTKHSSFAFAFEHLGLNYSEIYSAIISAALSRVQP